MNNYDITTDGNTVAEVEQRLKKYLPGLDVRLEAYEDTKAILSGPLYEALRIDYQPGGPMPVVKACGVLQAQSVTDDETLDLLQSRSTRYVRALADAAPLKVAGLDWHLSAVNAPAAWALLGGPDGIDWKDTLVAHIAPDTPNTLRSASRATHGSTWRTP